VYKQGHIGINLTLAASFFYAATVVGEPTLGGSGAVIIVLLARLPDRDAHFDSSMDYFAGHWLLYKVPISHRGVTHTLLFAFLVGGVIGGAGWAVGRQLAALSATRISTVYFLAGGIGIGGHLLGDAITPRGVPALWPLKRTDYSLGLVSADSMLNKILYMLGFIAAAAAIIHFFYSTGAGAPTPLLVFATA
jgi:inner membrane protein